MSCISLLCTHTGALKSYVSILDAAIGAATIPMLTAPSEASPVLHTWEASIARALPHAVHANSAIWILLVGGGA